MCDFRTHVDAFVEFAIPQAFRELPDAPVAAIRHERNCTPYHRIVERKRGINLVRLLRELYERERLRQPRSNDRSVLDEPDHACEDFGEDFFRSARRFLE